MLDEGQAAHNTPAVMYRRTLKLYKLKVNYTQLLYTVFDFGLN